MAISLVHISLGRWVKSDFMKSPIVKVVDVLALSMIAIGLCSYYGILWTISDTVNYTLFSAGAGISLTLLCISLIKCQRVPTGTSSTKIVASSEKATQLPKAAYAEQADCPIAPEDRPAKTPLSSLTDIKNQTIQTPAIVEPLERSLENPPISPTATVAPESSLKDPTISPAATVAPPEESFEEERLLHEAAYAKRQADFRAAVEDRLARKPLSSFSLPDITNPIMQAAAKEACFSSAPLQEGIKEFGGFQHTCRTTDKVPGVLFKTNSRQWGYDNAKYYVERADSARGVCIVHNLDLLYIPKCQEVEVDGHTFVMEEICDLTSGTYHSQESLYNWAIQEPSMRSHMNELLRQLAVFICLVEFSDVKYDNIALTKDGRIALFDIFDPPLLPGHNSIIIGLTYGRSYGPNGLFNILPSEWIDTFREHVKPYLKVDELQSLDISLITIKERAIQRIEYMMAIKEFYLREKVTVPNQPMVFCEERFSSCTPEIRNFAKKAIQYINLQLKERSEISLIMGRKTFILTNNYDKFPTEFDSYHTYTRLEQEGFEALKKAGYLFSYEIQKGTQCLLTC